MAMFIKLLTICIVLMVVFASDLASGPLLDLTEDSWTETLLAFKEHDGMAPMLITMIVGQCTAGICTSFTKSMRTAAIKLKEHRIAIVDCANTNVCNMIPQG